MLCCESRGLYAYLSDGCQASVGTDAADFGRASDPGRACHPPVGPALVVAKLGAREEIDQLEDRGEGAQGQG